MRRPALFHTIREQPHALDWDIIAVTTDKGAQLYGRDERMKPTHLRAEYAHGRYLELDHAEAARTQLRQIRDDHMPAVEAARKSERALTHGMLDALSQAVANMIVTPAPARAPRRRASVTK